MCRKRGRPEEYLKEYINRFDSIIDDGSIEDKSEFLLKKCKKHDVFSSGKGPACKAAASVIIVLTLNPFFNENKEPDTVEIQKYLPKFDNLEKFSVKRRTKEIKDFLDKEKL